MGVLVERRTELIADDGDRVVARLRHADGGETCEAAYIAGCDGARSLVRETMGIGFPGGTYQQVFYVADVEPSGPALDANCTSIWMMRIFAGCPLSSRQRFCLLLILICLWACG